MHVVSMSSARLPTEGPEVTDDPGPMADVTLQPRGVDGQTFAVALGSEHLHPFLDDNAAFELWPVRYVNDDVVTEWGVAELRGRSIRERASALIGIAHPNHRERLHFEAGRVGYP